MDNRLLILAASFAFLLFSIVYLVVAMVRARRVPPPPPMPDISEWPALNPAPPELVAASAEDRMFAEPTTGMAALLTTPLRASEWKPVDEADLPRTSRVDDYWDTLVEDEALLIRPSGHAPGSNPLVTDIWPDASAGVPLEVVRSEQKSASVAAPSVPSVLPPLETPPQTPSSVPPTPPVVVPQPAPTPQPAVQPAPTPQPAPAVETVAPAQADSQLNSMPAPIEDPQIAWIEQLVAELDEEEIPSPEPPSAKPIPSTLPPAEEPAPAVGALPISPAPVVAPPSPPPPPRPAVVVHETQRPPVMAPVQPTEPPRAPEPRPAVVIHSPEAVPAPAAAAVPAPASAADDRQPSSPQTARVVQPVEVPEHELVAPVEMWFGEVRIGVKEGTGTYDRFQMIAKVLFDDYKRATTAK